MNHLKRVPRAQMRILLDHSCVEVFLSTGEVLATRVYRGRPPLGADAGLDLVAFGGVARVERLEAWEMGAPSRLVRILQLPQTVTAWHRRERCVER